MGYDEEMSTDEQQDMNATIQLLQEKQLACEIVFAEYNNSLHATPIPIADAAVTKATKDMCPPVWDSIMCWESSKPGTLVQKNCPSYIFGFQTQGFATKECLSNGTWYKMNDKFPHYTNYTECIMDTDYLTELMNATGFKYFEPYMPALRIISAAGYSISLTSLLVAFTILASIQKLRCPRNVLHMHLFASFIMRACVILLRKWLFEKGFVVVDNGLESHTDNRVNIAVLMEFFNL